MRINGNPELLLPPNHRKRRLLAGSAACFLLTSVLAQHALGRRSRAPHPIVVVQQKLGDIFVPRSPEAAHVPLGRRIFDPTLEKELRAKFRSTFGATEFEVNGRFSFFRASLWQDELGYHQPYLATLDKQSNFGAFMIRRLIEYHADNYLRTNPDLAQVRQIKDYLSDPRVRVRPGYSLQAQYLLAENAASLRLESPMGGLEAQLLMDPHSVWPTRSRDLAVRVDRQLTPAFTLMGEYKIAQKSVSVVGTTRLESGFGLTVTGTRFLAGPGLDETHRGDLLLAGLDWDY